MENARPIKDEASAPGTGTRKSNRPARSLGTDNLRHLRALQAVTVRPIPREELDRVAGCANGPDLVAELRRLGLEMPCSRNRKLDRDMIACFPGVYHLTQADRRKLTAWKRQRAAGRGQQ